MLTLNSCIFGFTITACSICVAQVDIYQSDAYSVEEMCAREAEQNGSEDYGSAYENCIEKNRDNSMYQPGESDTNAEEQPNRTTDENGVDNEIDQAEKSTSS